VRRPALASGLAALLATSALTAPAWAQQDQPAVPAPPADAPAQATAPAGAPPAAELTPAPSAGAQTAVVQRILVEGAERIEPATVRSYLPIQPGETVDAARLDLALKTLYRTDLFADVQLSVRPNGDLVVQVIENPIINQVVFEGNDALSEDKLREEVTIRPRGIFTRSRVQQDVQRIVEQYRRSGRIGVIVTPKVVELPQKRVDLIFEIQEGSKTGVSRVNFLGNEAFSDGDLRGVVATQESRWYKFFSSRDQYDPDQLEYDREQLRKFYGNQGHYDFRVASAVAELLPDQSDFVLTFTVDEGPRYNFGELTVQTELQRLDPKLLQALLPIRKGDLYRADSIETAVDNLTFAAGAAGFAFVDIRPRFTPNRETRTVDVTFVVREGPRVYVERIDVVGNVRTLDPVVRRELQIVEGDAYNRVLVDRSRNRVRALGFFKDVTIDDDIQGSAPDRTVLRVNVEEQPTGELSFGAGFSSTEAFLIDLGITERNFRGRGQNLRARASIGSIRQQVDISFTEPRFLGRDLAAGVDLQSYRYDFGDQADFATQSIGGGVRLGFPLSPNSYMRTRYNLTQNEVVVDDVLCTTGQISRSLCDQRGANLTSLIGYTFQWDRRNDPVRPTRGFDLTARQDLAGLGGDVKYLRSEIEGTTYYGIRPEWVVQLGGSLGYVESFDGDRVRINDRFFKGGNTFRGFETAGMGPRDIRFDDPLGGKAYAIASVELSFPTPLPEEYGIDGALFLDVGTLGLLDDRDKLGQLVANGPIVTDPNIRDDLSLRASAGLSVFWDSPLGPIRFDFSQILAKEDYDKTETFRFSTNTRF
jgi:outer membrane protein insertion porin family